MQTSVEVFCSASGYLTFLGGAQTVSHGLFRTGPASRSLNLRNLWIPLESVIYKIYGFGLNIIWHGFAPTHFLYVSMA